MFLLSQHIIRSPRYPGHHQQRVMTGSSRGKRGARGPLSDPPAIRPAFFPFSFLQTRSLLPEHPVIPFSADPRGKADYRLGITGNVRYTHALVPGIPTRRIPSLLRTTDHEPSNTRPDLYSLSFSSARAPLLPPRSAQMIADEKSVPFMNRAPGVLRISVGPSDG